MLTWQDMANALKELGVEQGDFVLVHSSFKSLGPTENGADTVVKGLQAAVGEAGTVIFPTLCQKDWEHVYENWHLDAESDVGYLTNYFRKLPGAYRSDQASHSVAAMGKDAQWLTQTHGKSGLRYGIFGDSPFAADSPWEKMYHRNTKVLFVGVGIRKCTFRHYAEYCFMEEYLEKAKQGIRRKALQEGKTAEQAESEFAAMKARLWHYDRWSQGGVWPHVDSVYVLEKLEEQGKVRRGKCGEADVIMVSAGDFVDVTYELLEKRDLGVFWVDTKTWDVPMTLDWLKKVDEL